MPHTFSKAAMMQTIGKNLYWRHILVVWHTCVLLGVMALIICLQIIPNGDVIPPWPSPTGAVIGFQTMNG